MIGFNGLRSVNRLLCIGAHSDDIEIGVGATVLRVLRDSPNVEILWCVLSGNEQRHGEARTAASMLCEACKQKTLVLTGFPDAYFPAHQREIKQVFEQQLKPFNPDLILTHYRDDRHQDHRVVSELTWNTFRSHQIWEYEIPKWDGDLIQPNLYVPAEPGDVAKKIQTLMAAFGAATRSFHHGCLVTWKPGTGSRVVASSAAMFSVVAGSSR